MVSRPLGGLKLEARGVQQMITIQVIGFFMDVFTAVFDALKEQALESIVSAIPGLFGRL